MFKSNLTKNPVRFAFNKAHLTYDTNCQLQTITSNILINLISKHSTHFTTIIDLGCGTGITSKLATNELYYTNLLSIDIADNLIKIAKNRLSLSGWCILADFDYLPIKNDCVDLIFSNMALQWSYDINTTINNITKIMTKHGLLAFSLPTKGTFTELYNAIIKTDSPCFLNTFYSQSELIRLLQKYQIIEMGTYITTNYFKDIFSLLKSIKKIGGSCIKNNITPTLTKKNLSAINCYFEHTKKSAALPLTYEISFFIVREI